MTYFITGANGFLGSYLIKNILEKTSDTIIATDLTCPEDCQTNRVQWYRFDITDTHQIKELYNRFSDEKLKVLFLAAYLHPDLVQKNPRKAWKINIVALAEFLEIFDNIQKLYYPSTEVVYGQSKEKPFVETDDLRPVCLYGQQKIIAEKMITTCGYNVVRFPVLMGPSLLKDRKHFFDQIIEDVRCGKEVEMFCDQYRTFIDFNTAAKIVIDLMENSHFQKYQILNISGDEALSKYELGLRICKTYHLNSEKIKPIRMMGNNSIFEIAKRAETTLLDNSLVKKILNIKELKMEF